MPSSLEKYFIIVDRYKRLPKNGVIIGQCEIKSSFLIVVKVFAFSQLYKEGVSRVKQK